MACTYGFGDFIALLSLSWDDWELVEAGVAAVQQMERKAVDDAKKKGG